MADKELPDDDTGDIQKVFRELKMQKHCWDRLVTEAGTNCEIWRATCDSSQIDVYTGAFTTAQIHKYEKGGTIKICGSKVELPEAHRIS
jgi:hypothetical protein